MPLAFIRTRASKSRRLIDTRRLLETGRLLEDGSRVRFTVLQVPTEHHEIFAPIGVGSPIRSC